MEEEAALLKIIMLGDSTADKCQLISKFLGSLTNHSTIGVEFRTKIVSYRDKTYKLQIWDTAGQERYKSITAAYYRGANGVMIVYSDSHSYSNCLSWYQQTLDHELRVPIMLVHNSSDDISSCEESKNRLEGFSVPMMVVNAETGVNVNDAFMTLVDMIMNRSLLNESSALSHDRPIYQDRQDANSVPSKDRSTDEKSRCQVF